MLPKQPISGPQGARSCSKVIMLTLGASCSVTPQELALLTQAAKGKNGALAKCCQIAGHRPACPSAAHLQQDHFLRDSRDLS